MEYLKCFNHLVVNVSSNLHVEARRIIFGKVCRNLDNLSEQFRGKVHRPFNVIRRAIVVKNWVAKFCPYLPSQRVRSQRRNLGEPHREIGSRNLFEVECQIFLNVVGVYVEDADANAVDADG